MGRVALKVGLTGGIACGKTTVSDLFAGYGVPIIDADVIGHGLVQPAMPLLTRLVEAFGVEILAADGGLNRARLRARVLGNAAEKRRLEAIMHPAILAEMLRQVGEVAGEYVILSIPLLIEAGQVGVVDRVLVVDCLPDVQRARLVGRGLPSEQVGQLLAAQVDRETRLQFAQEVIENGGSREYLAEQVGRLHLFYLQLAACCCSSLSVSSECLNSCEKKDYL